MSAPIPTPKTQRERAMNCLRFLESTDREFTPVVLANMSGITLQWATRICYAAVRRGELRRVFRGVAGRPAIFTGARRSGGADNTNR